MKATQQQIKLIHTLLPDIYRQDRELKQELVSQFSEQGRVSTKELSTKEATALIAFLRTKQPAHRMRRKILSICYELGWVDQEGNLEWQRIQSFNLKYGHAHKPRLNDYTEEELRLLVTQYERLLESSYKQDSKAV